MVQYTWNSKINGKKQHILDENGVTQCRAENSGVNLDVVSETRHQQKKVCKICYRFNEHPRGAGSGRPPFKKKSKKTGSKPVHKKGRDPFLYTYEWKKVRYEALEFNDGRCSLCGISANDGAILNVDHIKPRRTHPELALTVSNLQVLCGTCNHGKGNDDTDWREPSLAKLMGEAI